MFDTIAGCQFLFRSDADTYQVSDGTGAIVASDNPVGLWRDQSANALSATGTTTARGVHRDDGLARCPGITFGTLGTLTAGLSFGQPASLSTFFDGDYSLVFYVRAPTALLGTYAFALAKSTTGNSRVLFNVSTEASLYRFGSAISGPAANIWLPGTWGRLVYTCQRIDASTANEKLYYNGVLVDIADGVTMPAVDTTSDWMIGNSSNRNNWPYSGNIGVVAGFTHLITAAEVLTIDQELLAAYSPVQAVFDGTSITFSLKALAANSYVSMVGRRLGINCCGYGVGGQTIDDLEARMVAYSDHAANAPLNIRVIEIGANDGGMSLVDFQTYMLIVVGSRRNAANKILVATILPRSNVSEGTFDDKNTWIRAGAGSWHDGLIDIAADPIMGLYATTSNATYYNDGVHPTALGNALLTEIYAAGIRPFLVDRGQYLSGASLDAIWARSGRSLDLDVGGKVLGMGAAVIQGVGVRAVDADGNALATSAQAENIKGRIPAALTDAGNMKADALLLNGAMPNNLAAGAAMTLTGDYDAAKTANAVAPDNAGITAAAASAASADGKLTTDRLAKIDGVMQASSYTAPPSASAIADAVRDVNNANPAANSLGAGVNTAASGGTSLTQQQVRDAMKLSPTAGDPATGSVDKHLDTIEGKTNIIGAISVTYSGPVASSGDVTVVRGNDYNVADGRELAWTSTSWPDLTGATVVLTVQRVSDGEDVIDSTPCVVSAPTGTARVYCNLSAAQTEALSPTSATVAYRYDVQATLANSRVVTLTRGTVVVLADYTD